MDATLQILLFIHVVAFGIAAATNVAMPLVARRMAGAEPTTIAALGGIARQLGINARISVATLVVTGVALLELKYGGVEGMNAWFWVKMVLVAVVVIFMVATAYLPRNALNPRILGPVMRLALLGIVLAAVMAFN
jgi:protoporphyrinogen IX oxidase